MAKGQIRVQTENIFPIIKKFLYSDHDIFLRELVSNAVDATQKIKTLASMGEAAGELGDLRIDIVLDPAAKTLTISDRGVGMTREEVEKYINQVAFSGAEEFLDKFKDASIIGHFGLGFYSAFMVSDEVEIFTKSYKDAPAVHWVCDGSPEYELTDTDKEERGTSIVLHINEESKEFLEAHRIQSILNKFCRFLPIPIFFTDLAEQKETAANEDQPEAEKTTEATEKKPINDTNPLWIRKPAELTDKDYQDFYHSLYPFSETPLFWIHLNVDYPFHLTGILYFPKIKQSYEIQKDKIQLYCNQVFVTDEVKDIVPEFLMLMHGVIDSPDIPLNVSRSYLQGDPNVKKINAHITKKVADKLEEIFTHDRKSFEEKWESLGLFVKYGMMTEDKFLDKATRFFIMEDTEKTDHPFYTLEEYKKATEALQKNKDGKFTIIYATNPIQQDAYIHGCVQKGLKVVKLETLVDTAFINAMEMKWQDVHFVRVDADIPENLIDKNELAESILSSTETEKLKNLFSFDNPDIRITTEIKGLPESAPPVTATRPEFNRRMKDMAAMNGGMSAFYAQMPDEVLLTVNGNHPVFKAILLEEQEEKQAKQVRTLADLALLSQGLLKGNELTAFINRSVELMENKGPKIITEV